MFVLNDIEEAVRAQSRKFVRERMPVAHLRSLRDAHDLDGFSRELWRELAQLGLVGATVPEPLGGAGLGYATLGLVLEECGRTLAPLPWLSTLLCAGAIVDSGSDAQKREYLPPLCAGERILAFAHDEGTRHSRTQVSTRAERVPGGFRLSGEKVLVLDGHVASSFLVSARTESRGGASSRDGLTLFVVDASAPGVSVERTLLVDSRNAARVRLDGVVANEAEVLGRVGQGADPIDRLLDRATISLSAEMLGGIEEVFERTLAYLKTRKQFGVPIGSFQALQHRAAQAFCEVELTRSVVRAALCAVDENRADVPLLACAAKARAADTYLLCAAEAVQMHGGIGVTDELDIGLFYKRASVASMTFGDSAWQRDRFARLKGY